MRAFTILSLLAALVFGPPALAQSTGCPICAGYSGNFTAGYVNWFTWNGDNHYMLVRLTNGEYHGFVNITRQTASAFSQLPATKTQQFYLSQVARNHEALLYEIGTYYCPLVFDGPPYGFLWTR